MAREGLGREGLGRGREGLGRGREGGAREGLVLIVSCL